MDQIPANAGEKRRKKGPPACSPSDQEHPTATTRKPRTPEAGRPETGPVIPPPGRAPPRARDRSGAFLPWAAPPSPHRHLTLFFLREAAAAPRHRSRSFQAARARYVQSGRAGRLLPAGSRTPSLPPQALTEAARPPRPAPPNPQPPPPTQRRGDRNFLRAGPLPPQKCRRL